MAFWPFKALLLLALADRAAELRTETVDLTANIFYSEFFLTCSPDVPETKNFKPTMYNQCSRCLASYVGSAVSTSFLPNLDKAAAR